MTPGAARPRRPGGGKGFPSPHPGAAAAGHGPDLHLKILALHDLGAERETQATVRFGPSLEELIAAGWLTRLHGALGPVIAPGRAARRQLKLPGHPLSTATATDRVAWREALLMAVSKGFSLGPSYRTHQRVIDAQGQQHALYLRISSGLPTGAAIAGICEAHRTDLRARYLHGIILYTLNERLLRKIQHGRPYLTIWEAVDLPDPHHPVRLSTATPR